MNTMLGINLRLAGKGLSVALALFLVLGTTVSGAVAVSCANGGSCLNCMTAMHADSSHAAGHMQASQGCPSDMQGSPCSFDNFDTLLNHQIAAAGTAMQSSEFSPALSEVAVEPESAAAKSFNLALHFEPPGPTVPIYLKILVFLC